MSRSKLDWVATRKNRRQLWEKASTRVDRDAALRKYRYFLIDHSFVLYDPTTFMRFPKDEHEIYLGLARLERHYSWVCSARRAEILRWTVARISKFHDFLRDRINSLQHETEKFLHDPKTWELYLLQRVIMELINSGDEAFREHRVAEAVKYTQRAVECFHNYSSLGFYMKRQEPLAKTGKRVKNGLKKSRLARQSFIEERRRQWRRWQEYIDDLHAKRPNARFSWLLLSASQEFDISIRTLYKHVKKSW